MKRYSNYELKRSFVTLRLDKDRLVMAASMPFEDAPMPPGLRMRDLKGIGHQGLGDTG